MLRQVMRREQQEAGRRHVQKRYCHDHKRNAGTASREPRDEQVICRYNRREKDAQQEWNRRAVRMRGMFTERTMFARFRRQPLALRGSRREIKKGHNGRYAPPQTS